MPSMIAMPNPLTPDRDRTLLLAVLLIMTAFFIGVGAYDRLALHPNPHHLSARK